MVTIKKLVTECGLTEEEAKTMKTMINMTAINEAFRDDNFMMNVIQESAEGKLNNDQWDKIYQLEGKTDIDVETAIDIIDKESMMKIANELVEDFINNFKQKTLKFKLRGYNHTNRYRTAHIPKYMDVQKGYYTLGRSGTYEAAEMIIEINVVTTKKIRGKKNIRGMAEGYYTINIKECLE